MEVLFYPNSKKSLNIFKKLSTINTILNFVLWSKVLDAFALFLKCLFLRKLGEEKEQQHFQREYRII